MIYQGQSPRSILKEQCQNSAEISKQDCLSPQPVFLHGGTLPTTQPPPARERVFPITVPSSQTAEPSYLGPRIGPEGSKAH